ncbi:MAG: hypothetical protein R3E89_18445 [Thiolinea sp.]
MAADAAEAAGDAVDATPGSGCRSGDAVSDQYNETKAAAADAVADTANSVAESRATKKQKPSRNYNSNNKFHSNNRYNCCAAFFSGPDSGERQRPLLHRHYLVLPFVSLRVAASKHRGKALLC